MSEKLVTQVSFVIESEMEDNTKETLEQLEEGGVLNKEDLFKHYADNMKQDLEDSLEDDEELTHFNVDTKFR